MSRLLLVLDTATRTPVLGLAEMDGRLLATRRWESRHRQGEQLLDELDGLLAEAGVTARDLAGTCVGIGPGSFTGLRIGLATAKVLAYSLRLPLVGVSTTTALALGAQLEGEVAVTLPAGAADRYVHRLRVSVDGARELGPAQLVATAEAFDQTVQGSTVLAVDFTPDDVTKTAVELGRRAVAGLTGAMAGLAARALADGRTNDVAQLVPAYVALPRGIAAAAQGIKWSPDLR